MDNTLIKWNDNQKCKQSHHFLIPSPSCRALVVGQSGCGKTSLVLNLILKPKWLDYNKLMVFGKSLHQPEYKLLKSGFEKHYTKEDILNFFTLGKGDVDCFTKNLIMNKKKCNSVNVQYFEDSDMIPDPKDINPRMKSVIIFDDVMTDSKQSKAEDFYTRGRHNNCSCIYISQNYHKLPRQTIRCNSNLLILFSLPKKDLQQIHNDFISQDMDWEEFNQFCDNVFKRQHSYIIINKALAADEGRYQENFNKIYVPTKFIL